MPRRRALIHIGLAKTGTKSIQDWCARRRPYLASLGIRFPRAGTINMRSGHHCLAWQLGKLEKADHFCKSPSIPALEDELGQSETDHAIMSSEEFSLLSHSAESIRTLLALFRQREITILAYAREQADYYNAYYVQLLSAGIELGTANEMAERWSQEPRADYRHWFQLWDDLAAGHLLVRPYDRHYLAAGDVLVDFWQVAGIPPLSSPRAAAEVHPTPNNRQVAVIAHLADRIRGLSLAVAAEPTRRKIGRFLNKAAELPDLAAGERYWGIEPSLVRSIRERFAASNRDFFRRHGIDDFVFSAAKDVPRKTAIEYEVLGSAIHRQVDRLWHEALPELVS